MIDSATGSTTIGIFEVGIIWEWMIYDPDNGA